MQPDRPTDQAGTQSYYLWKLQGSDQTNENKVKGLARNMTCSELLETLFWCLKQAAKDKPIGNVAEKLIDIVDADPLTVN